MRPKRSSFRDKALKEKFKQLCRETALLLAARINWQDKYVGVVVCPVVIPGLEQLHVLSQTSDFGELRVTLRHPLFDARTVLVEAEDPRLFECVIVNHPKRGILEGVEDWVNSTTPEEITNMIVNHILSLQKDVVVETKVPDQKPLRKIKATEI